jgi:hypothetical protein
VKELQVAYDAWNKELAKPLWGPPKVIKKKP